MKRFFFLFVLCSLLITGNSCTENIIVSPEFDNTEADYMAISKIELTDTATIVYADVYHLPKGDFCLCLINK
jgi:hypothetical protein